MTADYLDAKETGSSKDSIEITVVIKADKVLDFAHEIRDTVIDDVLEIIDELNDTKALVAKTPLGKSLHNTLANEIKAAVLELKGGDAG